MRQLTNPIRILDTDKQYISAGKYQLILDNDGNIDVDKSYYRYIVTNLPSDEQTPHTIAVRDIPAAFKSKLKEIHLMVVNHAENQGILKDGT
ncbi:MAG: hypothetical protein V2I33_23320, partial [Kangiellaceae bacterium]|nr:hypothetical protein [Kangiellaceae bacterium]